MKINESPRKCQALRRPTLNKAWHLSMGLALSFLKALHGAITALGDYLLVFHEKIVTRYLAASKGGYRG